MKSSCVTITKSSDIASSSSLFWRGEDCKSSEYVILSKKALRWGCHGAETPMSRPPQPVQLMSGVPSSRGPPKKGRKAAISFSRSGQQAQRGAAATHAGSADPGLGCPQIPPVGSPMWSSVCTLPGHLHPQTLRRCQQSQVLLHHGQGTKVGEGEVPQQAGAGPGEVGPPCLGGRERGRGGRLVVLVPPPSDWG